MPTPSLEVGRNTCEQVSMQVGSVVTKLIVVVYYSYGIMIHIANLMVVVHTNWYVLSFFNVLAAKNVVLAGVRVS